jgi:acetyl esterase/lipase
MPKPTTPRPVADRKAAFDKLGILQSRHPSVKFLKVVHVPHRGLSGRATVPVHPLKPTVSVHGKVNLYLHAGTYISGSITSHGGFASQICELTHRLTYFVDYGYVIIILPVLPP